MHDKLLLYIVYVNFAVTKYIIKFFFFYANLKFLF